MKPRTRSRKVVKWGGLVVALLLLVVWLGSLWYLVWWEAPHGGYICIQGGQFSIAEPLLRHGPEGTSWFMFDTWNQTFNWGFRFDRWVGGRSASVPLWAPLLAVLVMTVAAWRSDSRARRRERQGRCAKCNYDRAGLRPDSVCPECGGVFCDTPRV